MIRVSLKLVRIQLNIQIIINTVGCILTNIWNMTLQQHNLQKVDIDNWVRLYINISITQICVYKTFETLYSNYVALVLDYGSGIWVFKSFSKIVYSLEHKGLHHRLG